MYAEPKYGTRVTAGDPQESKPPADREPRHFTKADAKQIATNFSRRVASLSRSPQAGQPLRRFLALALLCGSAGLLPATANAVTPILCGSIHVIEAGDTLFKIANRTYGDGDKYEDIYKANSDLLPDSGSIEIGDQILIPCLDGSGPATRREAIAQGLLVAAEAQEAPVANRPLHEPGEPVVDRDPPSILRQSAARLVQAFAGPLQASVSPVQSAASAVGGTERLDRAVAGTVPGSEPSGAGLRLVTGSGLTPYADKSLPEGGMIPDLVRQAIGTAAPGQAFRIGFVDDWSSHLDVLLRYGAFDVSLPWYRPDCSKLDRLGAEARMLCSEFEFSDALVEVPFGYYARADAAVNAAQGHADLLGQRLCRPKGPFPFALEENGLRAPDISLTIADTAQDCLLRLMRSEVDVVVLLRSDADVQIGLLGFAGSVAEIAGLGSSATLHAVVARSDPAAPARLALLNRGLATLMASGKWFETVAFHQRQRLALAN